MNDLSEASVPALVEQAIESAKELASEEVRLALAEADSNVSSLQRALACWLGAAFVAGAALSWGGVAVVMALGLGATGAAVLAGLGLVVAGAAVWLGRRAMPISLFSRTRNRIERRVNHVKEALT